MPLVSFVCPDNPFRLASIDDCLACDHQCLPVPMLNMIWDTEVAGDPNHYHNNPNVISVTEAMWEGGCLRRAWFNRKRDYAEPPESFLARTKGTLLHAAVADADDDGHAEVELSLDLGGGWTLKGTADILTDEIVADWKTMKDVRKTYSPRDIEQLSAYNQMAGGGRKLWVYQWGHKSFAKHEVPEDEEALGGISLRAHELISALDSGDPSELPPEGKEKKLFQYDRNNLCHYCPHSDECDEIVD